MKKTLRSVLVWLLMATMLVTMLPFSVQAASNPDIIFDFLVEEMGLNNAAACGVLANIEKESSFNPNLYGDNGTSYGICQWHNSRFTALRNWCAANGYDYSTLNGQLHYLKFELSQNNSNYLWNGKTIYNKLAAVTNTAEGAYSAAYDWCYYYEVPANREIKAAQRGDLAQHTYWPVYGPSVATITKQPTTGYAKMGEKVKVTVEAEGDGLTYVWRVKNAGATKYSKSSITSNTYTATMSDKVKNRRVFCYVYDQYGNRVQSKSVLLREAVSITAQPKNTKVANGSIAKATVKASGDGLTYTWYIKNEGQTSYSKSSVTGAAYSCVMNSKSKNRLVYCVVTDQYGKKVKTEKVRLRMK